MRKSTIRNLPSLFSRLTLVTLVVTIGVLLPQRSTIAQTSTVPLDINQNGLSDIIVIDIQSSGALTWSYLDSTSGYTEKVALGGASALGKNGDHLAVGNWLSSATVQPGYISSDGNNVTWSILGNNGIESTQSGSTNSLALISGGDYDGNGVTDIAIVGANGKVTTVLNPFSSSQQLVFRRVAARVAKNAEKFFFIRTPLGRDSVGSLLPSPIGARRYRFRLVDPTTGVKVGRTLSKRIPGEILDVVPIKNASGSSQLLVFSKRPGGKTRVAIFDPITGAQLFSRILTSSQLFLVGKYLNQPGEQFAFVRGSELVFVAPFGDGQESVVTAPNGVLADHVNVNSFGSSSAPPDNGGDEPGGGGGDPGPGDCSAGVVPFDVGRLWKPKADASDSRKDKPVVLLQGSNKVGKSTLKIFSSNGVEICSLGFKASSIPGVNGGSDHYFSGWPGGCSATCGGMRQLSQSAGGNGNILVEWKGGQCLGEVDPCARDGSIP